MSIGRSYATRKKKKKKKVSMEGLVDLGLLTTGAPPESTTMSAPSALAQRRERVAARAALDAPRPPPYRGVGHLLAEHGVDAAALGGRGEVVDALARSVFGFADGLRPGQEAAVGALLDGNSVFASLPTGGGKTAIFHTMAAMSPGLALVVSPLLALIGEQTEKANARGIPASFLCSATSQATRAYIEGSLAMAGTPEELPAKILFVTPERVALPAFQDLYADLARRDLLSLLTVDEAHCMSEWGHDFRPDYANLGVLHSIAPHIPILAASGTAPPRVRRDVVSMLMRNDGAVVKPGQAPKGDAHAMVLVAESFDRPNLAYGVVHKTDSGVEDDIAKVIKSSFDGQAGIVYTLTTKDAERVSERLAAQGISTGYYHGGMDMADRASTQEAWTSGRIPVLCTTVAFGLGIDKSDVRFVIHHSLPLSLEGMYQQSGRAGRDGNPATCLVYYKSQDLFRAEKVSTPRAPPTGGEPGADDVVDRSREWLSKDKLDDMKQFCLTPTCRRAFLLQHFGKVGEGGEGGEDKKPYPCCDVCHPEAFPMSVFGAMQSSTDRGLGLTGPGKTGRGAERGRGRGRVTRTSPKRTRGSTSRATRLERSRSMPLRRGSSGDMYGKLERERKRLAEEYGIRERLVMSDAGLRAMADAKPSTVEELVEVEGVPRKKAARHGDHFLQAMWG